MEFAPTKQPDGLPDGPPAEQPADPPGYVASVQPVTAPRRRSRSLIAGAVLAGAIGITAIAVGLASTGAPAAAAPAANAQGVLLGADTGTWTAPNGATLNAPATSGVVGDTDDPGFGPGGFAPDGFGPDGGFGPGGMGRGGRLGGRGAFGSISITAIDGTKLGLKTADGWSRTIEAAGATVQNGGQTVDLSTLKVGDSIVFEQARQTDGTFKITALRVVLPHADGTVKSVTDSSATLTQPDGTDRVIQLTSSTTYRLAAAASTKAALTVGAMVDAEGTAAADGTFTASVVNIRPAVAAGAVSGKTATSITVTTRSGASLTIKVDSSTTYQVAGAANASLSNIAVGALVMTEGTQNADGTFSATVVRAFGAGSGFGPGMRGGRGMPWGPGMQVPAASPSPAGATN